jgi:hypothetical protein
MLAGLRELGDISPELNVGRLILPDVTQVNGVNRNVGKRCMTDQAHGERT